MTQELKGNNEMDDKMMTATKSDSREADDTEMDAKTDRGSTETPEPAADDERCCCSCKTTERSAEEVKKLINRLNRIEGQIRGIRGMVERDAYCPDILTQSAAVTAAMNAFNRELMSNHIKHCVVRDIRAGKEDTVDELVFTLQKLMK